MKFAKQNKRKGIRKKVRCGMQVVIDIPEEMYQKIKETSMFISGRRSGRMFDYILFNAVNTGTPLPKGHGRILDEKDILDTENNDGGLYDLVDMPDYIAGVKAIIESDMEESEEKINE